MSDRPDTPLLDTVQFRPTCARSARRGCRSWPTSFDEMISAVSQSGGHLGSGLGVVELTVAVHYVFDTPRTG